ncbi:ATP synthase subunit I [Paenibacillus sp. GCM10027626]|uniref:ATP synthase subunit I n=1 Tax=Paenibacillus sp. GCM10027626 TaxID=3273411 RepID=UPI003625C7CB
MDEMMNKAIRAALLFMACCLIVWGVVPEWRTVMAGMALGVLASVLNALMLRRRVEWIGRMVAEQGSRKVGLGAAGRMAMVLLVAMLAYRYPEYFNLPAALLSCFLMPFVMLAYAFILNKRNS